MSCSIATARAAPPPIPTACRSSPARRSIRTRSCSSTPTSGTRTWMAWSIRPTSACFWPATTIRARRPRWAGRSGDYDYSGTVDSTDFGLFLAGYNYYASNPVPLNWRWRRATGARAGGLPAGGAGIGESVELPSEAYFELAWIIQMTLAPVHAIATCSKCS